MRIVLFGPPGAGKGTQASLLAGRHQLTPISTGAILRVAMKEGTPLGLEARSYIVAGRLVPGLLVRRLAEQAIARNHFDNFILDGYPRTVEQARWLSDFLEAYKAPLHAVVSMQIPDEVIVERLSQRRVHRTTGETYHLAYRPPPADLAPDLILQRPDDLPDAIRERLEVYRRETQPVEAFYRKRGELVRIDGTGQFELIYQRITRVLPQRRRYAVA